MTDAEKIKKLLVEVQIAQADAAAWEKRYYRYVRSNKMARVESIATRLLAGMAANDKVDPRSIQSTVMVDSAISAAKVLVKLIDKLWEGELDEP